VKYFQLAALFILLSWQLGSQSRLIWSDEFNGPAGMAPDKSKWVHDLGAGGWGNKELQTYTDSTENARMDGRGRLHIRALKSEDGRFTSARLKTKGRFEGKYLRVVARMKVPRGQGLWPAFWMLGATFPEQDWPDCGEIDIMEHIGKEPSTTYGTIHGPGYSGAKAISGKHELPAGQEFNSAFHEYAVEWRPNEISFFADGVRFHTVSPGSIPKGARWVFDRPFFLLLNLAVGGLWPGYPDDSTPFPAVLEVDWIRVYQLS
jgi:beta-glucanase (GH16 family)